MDMSLFEILFIIMDQSLFNTFASEHLFFGVKTKEPYNQENKLTFKFLYDNFTKKNFISRKNFLSFKNLLPK